jgi:hypothetical protein
MKELIHFTVAGSTVCNSMSDTIEKFKANNPDVIYSKVSIDVDNRLFTYSAKKYNLFAIPAFLGIVDGNVQDGHIGKASDIILEALVR